MEKELTCAERVRDAFQGRMHDIRTMHEAGAWTPEEAVKLSEYENGNLAEYGLCIDKVEAGTFVDQDDAYIRYQLSWGGPSEEFHVYGDGRVVFWFLDWYDGASTQVMGKDADIITDIIEAAGFDLNNLNE